MAERDYLKAVNERVVVFDGGMGATLEQFDLTQEDYGGLQGKCHEALVLNRPDVIAGVHTSMLDALDHVGAVEDQRLVALARQPAVVLAAEVELLQGRAHAAVEDDNAAADGVDVVARGQGRKAYQP